MNPKRNCKEKRHVNRFISLQRKYKKMSLQSEYKHIKMTGIAQKSYIPLCPLQSLKKKDKLKLI